MDVSRSTLGAALAVLVVVGCGSNSTSDQSATPTTGAAIMTDETAAPTSVDPTTTRIEYGDAPQQFADLTVPGGDAEAPVVVLIHGGFWRNQYDLILMEPLAADLVGRGYAVWNLEYRRIGDNGGGWPGTFEDVAAGIDALAVAAEQHPLDLDRVAFVGHSAGGHLALWAAGRAALPADAPGGSPAVTPVVAIGQGAVVDLSGGAATGLGRGAVVELLGGAPGDVPERYAWASPALGAGPKMVSVVGSVDTIVPPRFSLDPQQPDGVEPIEIEGADHFDLIDPASSAWRAVVDRLDATIS